MRKPYIFLASKTEQENQLLKYKLEVLVKDFRNLSFLSVHHRGLIASLDQPAALVILNHNDYGNREHDDLLELRESGYHGPILVTAKVRAPEAITPLKAMSDVVFLEKPYEPRDLEGMVRKFLYEREVSQRIHRRYETAQEAEIEPYGKNSKFNSRVRNLSAGGAYIELISAAPLLEGELVRVKFDLSEMNRTYTMPARVVWAKKAPNKSSSAIGVEFIGPGDVRRLLVNAE